ncbi:MAG: hypothetical protein JNM10_10930 [Planctomycetia bacterium]|nr:hypothetical protein [Planctomycetia bacterium]
MSRRTRLAFVAVLAGAALGGLAGVAHPDDAATEAALLAAPEAPAHDPRAVRRAAEDALERDPADDRAWRALLAAVGRLADRDLLDDAIDRARATARPDLDPALGRALLRRARLDTPPDAERLREAATRLAPAETAGAPADALSLAHARHLLGDVAAAQRAYERALDGDEATGDLAWRGLESLLGHDDARLGPLSAELVARRPGCGAVVRGRADVLDRTAPRAGWDVLLGAKALLATSPRTMVALARRLRKADDRHADALALERRALAAAAGDVVVLDAVEVAWRQARPLASVADVDAFVADADALLAAVESDRARAFSYRNDLAFRLRDVVAAFAWRGEGRTQGLAAGAPREARAWLDRVVAWYDGAVARIPDDAASLPFAQRWVMAGVLNDAGLMRHYWRDVRDLDRAQALYLRAFDLTDGAYVDTYHYNLQYLFGIERPGQEELWLALARRASRSVLKEGPDGTFVPDEGKREAARKDAEALERVLRDRATPK